jgi:SAM-dependent methyltransferase
MSDSDPFRHLAPYYDPLMDHVDYPRWVMAIRALSKLLPKDFLHADLACGTGTLVGKLRALGWHSVGADLSLAMLESGQITRGPLPLACADLRALPFQGRIGFITCLFDSLNFLLEEREIIQAFAQFEQVLQPGGLLYFDVVTERMVIQHFEDQTWTEQSSGFASTWSSTYDRGKSVANTRVLIHGRQWSSLHERIYPTAWLEKALRDAGLTLLGRFDAHTWKRITRHTTRVDFVAMKPPAAAAATRFKPIAEQIRDRLKL